MTLLQAKPAWPALPLLVVDATADVVDDVADDVADRLDVAAYVTQSLVSAVRCVRLDGALDDPLAAAQVSGRLARERRYATEVTGGRELEPRPMISL